jgi:hypothetical protein
MIVSIIVIHVIFAHPSLSPLRHMCMRGRFHMYRRRMCYSVYMQYMVYNCVYYCDTPMTTASYGIVDGIKDTCVVC